MKILIATNLDTTDKENPTYTAVEYYRMFKPLAVIQRYYPEYELEAIPKYEFDLANIHLNFKMHSDQRKHFLKERIKDKDLILINREFYKEGIDFLKENNKPYCLDLDDYWKLPGDHILSSHYLKNDIATQTEYAIQNALFVTTTTEILAEKIRPFNPNVYVIENGIDSEDEIWQPNKTQSNRLRFGFTGGSSHEQDMKLVYASVRKALAMPEFQALGQIVLTGFSKPDDELALTWKKFTYYQSCELQMTDGFTLLKNPVYKQTLFNFEPYNDLNEPYRRIYGLPMLEFPIVYDSIDVVVAPLKSSIFNSCKSELKMLEASAKDCAIMVHHQAPYKILATDKNSCDLNKKTFREWAKILIKNPNLVRDLKSQLRVDCERYNLKHLSVKRNEIYKKYI